MRQNLGHIAIVVEDYDNAIDFYTTKLQFDLIEDLVLSETKRWVLVRPKGSNGCSILLAKGVNEVQRSRIGNQTGGRVFLFLHTDNFERDYQNLVDNNIIIFRAPSSEEYGKVAVFEDLYGNLWDLIELNQPETYFYSTDILKIKNPAELDLIISKLKHLRNKTLLENGNISFEIQQEKNDPTRIILWECFKDENSYNVHLKSDHLQEFLKLDLVKLEKGYITSNIE